ncbi:hypothetical protein Tco_0547537 [Tanacetum coccineum]
MRTLARRPDSAVHHTGDDYVLGNLKFVPKGESVEVFGMAIPDPLITEAIKPILLLSPQKYQKIVCWEVQRKPLEKVQACNLQQSVLHPKSPQPLTTVKQTKPAPPPSNLDPAFLPQGQAPVGGVTIRDPVSETTPKLHEVVGKGKAVVTEEQVAHSLIDLLRRKDNASVYPLLDKEIHESSSTSDSERTESDTEAAAPKGDKDQDEVDTSTVTSGVSIPVSAPEKAHEALARPDPEPMKEDRHGSDSGKLHVSLAGQTC